jgi:multidrug transporter EmrE-like cation transporter
VSGLAFALVLTAALGHATWNVLAKHSGGGLEFIWLFGAVSTVLLAVPALVAVLVVHPVLGWAQVLFIVGSGVLHIAYFVLLQTGYRVGDMSIVYPSARGTGVLAGTLGGIVVFGEHPGALALAGAALVVIGVVGAGASNARVSLASAGPALAYGLLTGAVIGAYTLWDKHAVDALAIPPLFYYWGFNLITVLGMSWIVFRNPTGVQREWQRNKLPVLGVGILAPASYALVLYALVFTPVSFVSPVRETAIVFGTAMGIFLLREGNARMRLLASAVIAVGVVMLAVG